MRKVVSPVIAVVFLILGMILYSVGRRLNIFRWVSLFGSSEEEFTLREFIYLDEVSVVSLLASLTREITESRTDTETTESQKRSRFRLRAFTSKIPGFGAAHERLNINRDTEEVVRKSEIQSKFDELYGETADNFQLAAGQDDVCIPVSEFQEGGVSELEIEFSAHELYHFYNAYQYIFDVFEEHVEEFDAEQKQIIELMGSLFGERIPVVGEATNYRVAENEIRSLDTIEDDEEAEPLQIVGTLDPDMLWQEASTFLYEENKFTAYVRVPEAKLQEDWDPLKLTRVIRSISAEIGDSLSGMIEMSLKEAKQELDETDLEDEDESIDLVQDSHDTYLDKIEEMGGIELDEDRRQELVEEAFAEVLGGQESSKVEIQTDLLKNIADLAEEQENLDLDRGELSDLRIELMSQKSGQGVTPSTEDGNYLEVSFVAIYW